jgi:hypothetical protein
MAFAKRLFTQPFPSIPPDVEIYFHGQLLLRSENGAICEVGINPIASNHVLTVEVRRKQLNKPDLILMRHVGPLKFRRATGGGAAIEPGMIIEVANPVAPTQAAWSCEGPDVLNYASGDGQYDKDFRWILNLEGNLFHDKDLTPSVFGTTDMIRLQNGEFFFRTAFRSPDRLKYERRSGGKAPLDFRKIGAIARASVFLAEHQNVLVTWNDGGPDDRVLTLTKSTMGITYEIYIQHTPLFQQPGVVTGHDEIAQFYRIIPEVPGGDRFTFGVVDAPLGPPPDTGSPDIPCQVLKLNGPGGGG